MKDFPVTCKIPVTKVPAKGREEHLEISESELQALADYLDVINIKNIKNKFHLDPADEGVVRVRGTCSAIVTYECTLSLQDFEAPLETTFDRLFAPSNKIKNDPEIEDWETEDAFETIEDGKIDLGSLLCIELSLALDPYPRKPGVLWDEIQPLETRPLEKVSPFSALKEKFI